MAHFCPKTSRGREVRIQRNQDREGHKGQRDRARGKDETSKEDDWRGPERGKKKMKNPRR